MNTESLDSRVSSLRSAWEELKESKPNLRIRDCADELNVSEAELLATTVGDYSTRLDGDWTQLLQRLPELGRVMSLTRNDACVLEHKGTFQKVDIMGEKPHNMATVIGPIESRVFFNAWKYGFAVRQQTPRGLMQSLQIFDGAGQAITKIFLLEDDEAGKKGSNVEAYNSIVENFKATSQHQEIQIVPSRKFETRAIKDVDKAQLLREWKDLKDTHDFFGLLRKHKVNRLDAVVLAENEFTYRIDKSSLRTMLETAAKNKLPIMIFAGNNGNLQIHQGKVQTIRVMDQWLNVLDPDFNMHLREDLIESVWVVRKPTSDGDVTGIEVFDANKEMIVQFFGLRKPGIAELEPWRELVASLPKV